jgi:hypothetical protein
MLSHCEWLRSLMMASPSPGENVRRSPPVQLAYTVSDAAGAAAAWAAEHGAGPFFLLPHIPLDRVVVHGQASSFDHSSAYGWHGEVMIELVQQHCDTPTIFNDRPYGLHHVAHFVPDLAQALAGHQQAGRPLAMQARTAPASTTEPGTAFAFVDARATHGHYLELYEPSERLTGFYAMVRTASERWDGRTDPVRRLPVQR